MLDKVTISGQSNTKNTRRSSRIHVYVFGNASFTTPYHINNKSQQAPTIGQIFSGDVSFTALGVNMGSSILYLPGFGSENFGSKRVTETGLGQSAHSHSPYNWGDYVDENNGLTSGLIRTSTSELASVFPTNEQMIGFFKNPSYDLYNTYFYVTRFVLVGSGANSTVLSIANVPEDFHQETDLFGTTIQTEDSGNLANSKVTLDNDRTSMDWSTMSANLYTDSTMSTDNMISGLPFLILIIRALFLVTLVALTPNYFHIYTCCICNCWW